MVKAIVFDCFGVLVGKNFWDSYRAAGGNPVKDADFIEEMLGRANAGLISSADFYEAVARQLGVSTADYQKIVAQQEQPNEEVFDLIQKELHGRYKLAILSNANVGTLQRRIPADKLALFDTTVVSAEVGLEKPDQRIFELVAERLGVDFKEMVFIDDLERYIEPARALGIRTIHFVHFENFKQELHKLLAR